MFDAEATMLNTGLYLLLIHCLFIAYSLLIYCFDRSYRDLAQ